MLCEITLSCKCFNTLVATLGRHSLLDRFVKFDTWISLSCWMDLSKFIHEFLSVALLICQSGYMDLLKSLNGFVKVVLCIPRPLPYQIKLKFDQDFKASALN